MRSMFLNSNLETFGSPAYVSDIRRDADVLCGKYSNKKPSCMGCMAKSYGRVDYTWNEAKIRVILEEASGMARERDASFCVGEDGDGNIIICPNEKGSSSHIFACGVTHKKILDNWKDIYSPEEIERNLEAEFWNDAAYEDYSIDEMVPIVYECLVYGIKSYGGLRFLSEGRMQLAYAMDDAKKMTEKYGAPFIVGRGRKDGIMIAPVSRQSRFVESLACIISKSGYWNVSDMHSSRIFNPDYYVVGKHEIDTLNSLDNTGALFMLYEGMAYGLKRYGAFRINMGRDAALAQLENAFEDAAKLSMFRKMPFYVGLNTQSGISVQCEKESMPGSTLCVSFKVNPYELYDGTILSYDGIKSAARDAYGECSAEYARMRERKKT